MADVITRFKLETTQYDSKLRDASQALSQYARVAAQAGNEFDKFTKDQAEAARALGSISTSANNAKDKVRELVNAYNQAANAYNALTKEQQQSDWGRALAESINTLKGRITEAKQELYSMNDAIKDVKKNSSGLFGEGGLTGMLAVTGGNLLASGIQKLGSEIMDTVQQGVELARAGEGVRLAFERLNRPGLLDNLKEATHGTVSELELMKAAVKFDDFNLPVEQLGTLLAFAQKKAKDTGQSVDYMVDSIVTGLGRKSLMILDNLGLSAAQIKDRMKESGDMTVAVADIIKEQMAEAGEYVETAADRAARAAADAANEMEKLGMKAGPVAEEWGRTWNEIKFAGIDLLNTVLTPIADSLRDIREILSGEYTLKIKTEFDNPLGPNVDDNGNYIKKPGSGNWAGFNANNGTWKNGYYGAIYNSSTGQMEFPDFVVNGTNRQKTKKKTKTTGGGGNNDVSYIAGSIGAYEQRIAELKKDQKDVTSTEKWDDLQSKIGELTIKVKELKGELKVEPYDFKKDTGAMVKAENETFTKRTNNVDKIITDSIKKHGGLVGIGTQKEVSVMGEVSKMAGGINSIASGIEALGVELPEDLKNVLNGLQGLISIVSGIATVVTAIQSIQTAQMFKLWSGGGIVKAASGMVVPGSAYGFDGIPSLLTSGELVLNRAQQGVLAGALEGGAGRSVHVTGHLEGETIVLAADRYGRRTGKGELAFWK